MPVFEYVAINKNGRNIKGSIDAENPRVAKQKLKGQGLYPTSMKEASKAKLAKTQDIRQFFTSESLSVPELAVATRQLATLVSAGLPLVSALNALADQTDSQVLRRIVVDIREDVEEGSSLAKALGKFPKSFPRLYINLVAAGEASGNLDRVLTNLADYLERQVELRRKVSSALLYPILMLFVCSAVIIALLVFVIPKIVEIFKKQGAQLPLPTQITIGVSNLLIDYWYLLILLIAGFIFTLRWYYRQPAGRSRIDEILLRLPLFGSLYTKVSTARVAATLGTLLGSGVELLKGLDITKNIIGNVHMVKALEVARDNVREGKTLAGELGRSGRFPSMLSHMVAVGEKSGQLEQMLSKAGQAYENEVSNAIDGLTSLLEPLLMIIVGTIVGLIVISVLLPMADLINLVN